MATPPKPGIGEIKSKEHVQVEKQRDRYRAMFEGWRTIGEAMLGVAFGYNMRGMQEIPPIELLEAINNPREGANVIGTLRDSLLGQAWRVRGREGTGTCDYPLCEHRDSAGVPLSLVMLRVPRKREGSLGFGTDGQRFDTAGQLRAHDGECLTWAHWIAARSLAGRIKVA